MAISEARQRANAKYNKKTYDRLEMKVPKGKKADIINHAEKQGESLNKFLNRAVENQIIIDNNSSEYNDVSTDDDLQAIQEAQDEYADGKTVNHNDIDWD